MNRGERLVRSLSATAVAVLIAAISHVFAGAATPHIVAVAVTVAVAWPAALWLSGKRLSLTRLLALVLGSQALFHFAFGMVGQPASEAHPVATANHALHAISTSDILPAAVSSQVTHTWLMWLAHATAAVVTVIVLRFGERAALTLASFVRDALSGLHVIASHAAPVVVRHSLPSFTYSASPNHQWIMLGMTRRGPPLY